MRVLLYLLIAQATLLMPTWCSATLIDATSTVTARCHSGLRDSVTGVPQEASAACSAATPGVFSSATVSTTFGGIFPQIGAVTAAASLSRGSVVGAPSDTFSNGQVSYSFAVEGIAPAPFLPTSVPLRFHASGQISVAGDNIFPSSAGAFIAGNDTAFLGVELDGVGRVAFDDSITAWVDVGSPYSISVFAFCNLRLGAPGTSTSCAADADPSLAFDQLAFNTMYQDPFQLESFFGISYSGNVEFEPPPQNVSEASSLSLLGVALFQLMHVRRRRLQSRRQL